MQQSDWYRVFQTLKQRGVDTLTDQERKLRRLPIQAIKTVEAVFQPRHSGDESASGKHLEELKRVLHDRGVLDPIVVMKLGGEWVCIDGHHRLEAYRQSEGKRTHVPMKVFTGTVGEALKASVATNAPDKLNLSKDDKLESAWRLVLLKEDSVARISQITTISERTIQHMRRTLEQIRKEHPSVAFEEWPWRKIKELLRGHLKGDQTIWQEAKAREWAKQLAKSFSGLLREYPTVFAQALLQYNPETARIIAEDVLKKSTRKAAEVAGEDEF